MKSPTPADIRSARKDAGLTQSEAGALIGSHQVTWARYENGTRSMDAARWQLWLHLAGIERLPFHDRKTNANHADKPP